MTTPDRPAPEQKECPECGYTFTFGICTKCGWADRPAPESCGCYLYSDGAGDRCLYPSTLARLKEAEASLAKEIKGHNDAALRLKEANNARLRGALEKIADSNFPFVTAPCSTEKEIRGIARAALASDAGKGTEEEGKRTIETDWIPEIPCRCGTGEPCFAHLLASDAGKP